MLVLRSAWRVAICCLLLCCLALPACAQSYGEEGSGMTAFGTEIPEDIRASLQGTGLEGYACLEGYYFTRFHDKSYAQMILAGDGGYVLCALFHRDGAWELTYGRTALLQDEVPKLVPEPEYGYDFEVAYGDESGLQHRYRFFFGSDAWRFEGVKILSGGAQVKHITASDRTIQIENQQVFNVLPLTLAEFDMKAFPLAYEDALKLAETAPEANDNIGIIKDTLSYSAYAPQARLYTEPAIGANVIFECFGRSSVEILSEADGFYQVRLAGVTGYLPKEAVATGQEKAAMFTFGIQGVTIGKTSENAIPIYATPDANATPIAQEVMAESVYMRGITVDREWLYIETLDNPPTAGYARINSVGQSSNFWGAVVNNPNPQDRLHMRTAPDKNAESLGKYYSGVEVRFLFGTQNDNEGPWRQVCIEGVYGYMMSEFLDYRSDSWTYPYLPPLGTVKSAEGQTLRASPSASSQVLVTYPKGETVEVLAIAGDWAHVRGRDGNAGYMPLNSIGGEPKQAVSTRIEVIRDTPLYPSDSEDSDYSESTMLRTGDKVHIDERPMDKWRREYIEETDSFGGIYLDQNHEWVYVMKDDQNSGFVKWENLADPWQP